MISLRDILQYLPENKVEEIQKSLITTRKVSWQPPQWMTPIRKSLQIILQDYQRLKEAFSNLDSERESILRYVYSQGGQVRIEEIYSKFPSSKPAVETLLNQYLLFENFLLKQKVGWNVLSFPKEYSRYIELTFDEKNTLGFLLELQPSNYHSQLATTFALERKVGSKFYLSYLLKQKLLGLNFQQEASTMELFKTKQNNRHEFLQNLVRTLPEKEKQILQFALNSQGVIDRNDLKKLGYKDINVSSYAARYGDNPIQNLYHHALLFPNVPEGYYPEFFIVPVELYELLIPKEKREIKVDISKTAPQYLHSYGLRLLSDLYLYTAYLHSGSLKLTQKDIPVKKQLDNFLTALGIDEENYGMFLDFTTKFIYELLLSKSTQKDYSLLEEYFLLKKTELLKKIIHHWRNTYHWQESCYYRYYKKFPYKGIYDGSLKEKRQLLLGVLKLLPAEQWVDIENFYKLVDLKGWKRTDIKRYHRENRYEFDFMSPYYTLPATERTFLNSAETLNAMLTESLLWLGIIDLGLRETKKGRKEISHIRVTQYGRYFSEGKVVPPSDELSLLPKQEQFSVLPNMEIIIPQHIKFSYLIDLFKISSLNNQNSFTITKESLRYALDTGMKLDAILEFLKTNSKTPIPQNVQRFIEDISQKHGHIKVGIAGCYLEVSDPLLLAELKSNKLIRPLFKRQLGDNIVILSEIDFKKVVNILKKSGYFPVIEISDDEIEDLKMSVWRL